MNLVRLTQADLARLRELQPPDWAPIEVPFARYVQSPQCVALGIEIEGALAGIATRIIFGRSAWLAQVITAPSFRGRGVASVLIETHLEALDELQVPTVGLIATPQGQAIYHRFGFDPVAQYRFYDTPTQLASMRAESVSAVGWHDRILECDKLWTGEDRSLWLKPHLQTARVISSGGALQGFWCPDLGDGLILARDVLAGISLLSERLAQARKTVVPEGTQAAEFLEGLGAQCTATGQRMIRGKPLSWQPQRWFSRVGGNIG